MWNKIINYKKIIGSGVIVSEGQDYTKSNGIINNVFLGYTDELSLFKIDVLILNLIYNRSLLKKIILKKGNFLFHASYYENDDIIERAANLCSKAMFSKEVNFLALRNIKTSRDFRLTDVIILFDVEDLRKSLFLANFIGKLSIPIFIVSETSDSYSSKFYPMFGNNTSLLSVKFFARFVESCFNVYK